MQCSNAAAAASSSIQLSATGRHLDITYMCYEFRTPLFPAQLLQARQSDLSVTSIPQSVNRWRHNEFSCCSHPLLFVPASHTPVVKVRLVVWRSDLTGQGAAAAAAAVVIIANMMRRYYHWLCQQGSWSNAGSILAHWPALNQHWLLLLSYPGSCGFVTTSKELFRFL